MCASEQCVSGYCVGSPEDTGVGHENCAEQPVEGELNHLETPLGWAPTLAPSYVQHLHAFQTQLRQVEEACRQNQKLRKTSANRDGIEATAAVAAAEENTQEDH